MKETSDQLKAFLKGLSTSPGVYRMYNAEEALLYVGKARNLFKRVNSYFSKTHDNPRIRSLVSQIEQIKVTLTLSETEALILEASLIKQHRPKYNVLMRDDKSYPYIKVSAHSYPRMEMFRSKQKPSKGEFYGPYPSVHALKTSLNTIQKLFKIRNCRDSFYHARTRPCLQYQIKRCTAPCVDYVSKEAYQQQLDHARQFLQGKSREIIKNLEQKMAEAVAALAYERAAELRDQIKQLRITQEQQGVSVLRGDADAIAIHATIGFACVQQMSIRNGEVLGSQVFFPKISETPFEDAQVGRLYQAVLDAFVSNYYFDDPARIPKTLIIEALPEDAAAIEAVLSERRGTRVVLSVPVRGSKKAWLELARHNLSRALLEHRSMQDTLHNRFDTLAELLAIQTPIERMECFDISHSLGEATVASCVVFSRQGPVKNRYRQFNIEGITPGDDYAAMKQALSRRLGRLQMENDLPDVLVIDGGKGQLNVAQSVLDTLQISSVFLLGLAKGEERKAGWEQLILPDQTALRLDAHSPALQLLQHIRDEAHRFAIQQHRKKRQKMRKTSSLESIEGIGPKKRRALMHRFGGLKELAKASIEELQKVEGVSQTLAEKIHQFFRETRR